MRNFHAFGIYIPDMKTKENVLINTTHNKLLSAQDELNRRKTLPKNFDKMEDQMTDGKPKI